MPAKGWSKYRSIIPALVADYETSPSVRATAFKLNVTPQTAWGLLKRAGVKIRPKSEANKNAFTEDRKRSYSNRMKGKPSSTKGMKGRWSFQYREKLWVRGENSHFRKGGVTPLRQEIRNSNRYSKWRVKVFQRDNYTCRSCGKRGARLQADHAVSFSSLMDMYKIENYIDAMRCDGPWSVDNGRTLCFPCHKKTYNYAGRSFRRAINA